MSLTPDFSKLRKTQFSSAPKGVIHTVLQLDNSYPLGGYPVTSEILFGVSGYNFFLMDGYSVDGPTQFHYTVHQDVDNQKLQVINHATGQEEPAGTGMATNYIHCTFLVW
jgi:hypothetical protein